MALYSSPETTPFFELKYLIPAPYTQFSHITTISGLTPPQHPPSHFFLFISKFTSKINITVNVAGYLILTIRVKTSPYNYSETPVHQNPDLIKI